MNNLFLSQHLAFALKGKNKWIEVLIAGLFVILFIIPFGNNLINFLTGQPIHTLELIAPPLIVYFVLNFVYTLFHTEAETPNEKDTTKIHPTTIKLSPKGNTEKKQDNEVVILRTKNYALEQVKKVTPQVPETITKAQQNVATLIHVNKPVKKTDIEKAPPLEVNFESAAELMEDESESFSHDYTGVVHENLGSEHGNNAGNQEIHDTTLPSDEAKLFNTVSKKKFT